jgi:hypothetical protein
MECLMAKMEAIQEKEIIEDMRAWRKEMKAN